MALRALPLLDRAVSDHIGESDPVAQLVRQAADTGDPGDYSTAKEAFGRLSIRHRRRINDRAIALAEKERAQQRAAKSRLKPPTGLDSKINWLND